MARATLVVERLPVVLDRALAGHPGSEIRLGGFRVVVPVVLAVVPVVPLVRSAVRGLPLIVDVHVVVLLAVVPLLLVLGIVLVTPVVVRGLPVAVVLVAIGFAVREVSVWVVVLRELTPSPGPGCQAKTGEAASIMSANNPKSTINLLNFFSFPEQVPTPSTDA